MGGLEQQGRILLWAAEGRRGCRTEGRERAWRGPEPANLQIRIKGADR
jgi:hypothetical protein